MIIAFDSCLISLEYLKNLISKVDNTCKNGVATGQNKKERDKVNKFFSIDSNETNTIALCSDAMSEGLNLQKASSVVLLDMPSVIRVAEQRVGRVDRMNSPHKSIEVWWPKDDDIFSLKADKNFPKTWRG